MDKSMKIMPEDIQRIIGKDAQRMNILAAKTVADVVKTTLGPKGMDKMLVSPMNEIIVTNDGVTILSEMQIEHPAAKMMVEIAKTQESEVGDGTTTSVMIAGKLLENAEDLLDKKIHPTVITKGYKIAAKKAQEILKDISVKITSDNEEVLRQIAMTAMTGKGAEDSREKLAEIIVKAVKQVWIGKADMNDIKIEKVKGESVGESELLCGVVIDKERVSKEMPKMIHDAKIALVDFALELKNPEIETKISVSSPEDLQKFLNQEESAIKNIVEKIKNSGANVVFCQRGIDEFAEYLLTKENIYSCKRVARADIEKLAKATGARVVSSLNELGFSQLGRARVVEEIRQNDRNFTYVRDCENPRALTILIKGGTEHVVNEIERAIKDGIGDVSCSIESGLVVAGGGAVETEIAKRLRDFGSGLAGREKLAVEEFANALEFIPVTLAENAGLDPIEILTELKYRHDAGEIHAGINLFTNKIENNLASKIIEPYKIKAQAISSATEVASMILRIDDVIASSGSKKGMNYTGEEYFQKLRS
jgi:thermosome